MSQGQHRHDPSGWGARFPRHVLSPDAVSRLEEIADLHRAAASPRTALDYLGQAIAGLDPGDEDRLAVAARLHRKRADAALDLGDLESARRDLEQAAACLSRLPGGGDPVTTAVLEGRRAALLVQEGAYDRALDLCKRAFAVLAVTDRHREVANVLATMGVCHHRRGRLDKAREFYGDAAAAYRRAGDRLGVAAQYSNLALLDKNACRWSQAEEWLAKGLAVADELGATHFQCRLLLNLGIVQLKRGDAPGARRSLEKGLLLARGLGDRDRETKFLLAVGALELADGNLLRAEECLLDAKNQADEIGFWRESVIADEYLGDLQLARGDAAAALANYRLGLERAAAGGDHPDLVGELRRREAQALAAAGEAGRALETARAAAAVCRRCGELFEVGFCLAVAGSALAALGRHREAREAFDQAARTFREQQLPHHEAAVLVAGVREAVAGAAPRELLPWERRVGDLLAEPDRLRDDRQRLELLAAQARLLVARERWDEALQAVAHLADTLERQPDEQVARETAAIQRRLDEVLDLSYAGASGQPSLAELMQLLREAGPGETAPLARALDLALAMVGDGGAGCLLAAPEHGGDAWRLLAARGMDEERALALAACIRERLGRRWRRPAVLHRPVLAACRSEDDPPAGETVFQLPLGDPGRPHGVMILAPSGEAPANILAALERLGGVSAVLAEALEADGDDTPDRDSGRAFGRDVGFLTRNRGMQRVLELARTVAASELTVLLQGETGTGKGLLARAIHVASHRRRGRFLAVNCAAIPESLLESELFGHVRGSFTGAVADKKGLLAEADGGTVFLDEIGKLPLAMQGKLLHFLDTRQVRPVGSNTTRTVDVRIVCATKSDLSARVQEGTFLEDLYYRLSDFPIDVPPLRRRRDDLPLLARHFVARYTRRAGIPTPGLSRAFLTALERYSWPGNVRELEKVVIRAVVLARGAPVLTPELLPFGPPPPAPDEDSGIRPLRDTVQRVERREIAAALEATGGNKSAAARLLRISYPSLLKKIRLYGLAPDPEE